MDINITQIIQAHESNQNPMKYYSASQAELGSDAGRVTWENSVDAFDDEDGHFELLLVTDQQLENARKWFAGFGAWDREEIDTWTVAETNALLLQFIAGDIREAEDCIFDDYEEYQIQCEQGSLSGRIYKSDEEWFIYVGN